MSSLTLTSDRARELLDYNSETGIFTWKERDIGASACPRTSKSWNTRYAGTTAGARGANGYLYINFDGRKHLAHRVAWLVTYGRLPTLELDHMDGDRANNRIANLRDVSASENNENRRRAQTTNKTTGLIGASRHSNGKGYVAQIIVKGVHKYLGYFQTAQEAHEAYVAAKRRFHRGCTI
ncbi:HNH endonuclease [Achromobacter marplatensis]|uniref:HNH endonuclease n=1 Tax=Achromobacter marplatensis TaxID=470868 RepID=UPI003C77B928